MCDTDEMDRLIAYRGNEPERLRASLMAERAVLFPDLPEEALFADPASPEANAASGASGPAAGPQLRWGIGYYVGGEPHVQRFSATLAQGFAALRALRADVVIGQVGSHGTPVPPYRYGRYLLGLHGDVPKLDVQVSELTQALPSFLHYNLRDHSPGERLLHLVCARLHEAAPEYLTDPHLSPEVAVAALAAVLQAVVGAAPPHVGPGGQPAARTLTMTMSNGDWLAVAQHGGPAIWYQALAGVGEGEQRSESYRGVWALGQPDADAHKNAAAGWKQIPQTHALVVDHDVTFEILPLG
jgi:hypothetical protein